MTTAADDQCPDCSYVDLMVTGRLDPVRSVPSVECPKHRAQRLYLNPQVRFDDEGTAYIDEGVKP